MRRARTGLAAFAAAGLMTFAGCATTGTIGPEGESEAGARFHMPPIVWWDRSPDGSREVRNFLGFIYSQRSESSPAEQSSPETRVASSSSLDILWPIYHRSEVVAADGMRTTTRSLMPFVWASRRSEPSGRGTDYVRKRVIIPPLLFSLNSDNYGSGQIEYGFLWPLGKYFRGERLRDGRREMARSFIFRPFVRYERTWPLATGSGASAGIGGFGRSSDSSRETTDAASARGTGRPGEVVRVRVLTPLFGYERDADLQRKRAFLLGGILDGGGPGKERTLGFLAAERGPATDYEIQALWQFFMMKRSGSEEIAARAFAPEKPSDMWRATKWLFGGSPHKEFRLGPVFDYVSDWSSDRKEFSVLFGLISYAREGNRRQGRIFWFIPWRP
jgi:hypothetical protein